MFKVGLTLGRNALKLEGNFQLGYHSKIDKKYTAVDGKTILPAIEGEENIHLIHDEENENEHG